jgi:hypothetical protein
MQWAPDSPDLWAPDSGRPNQWAPDTFEHLTLRRGVDLFLGAKAAEGASPKTITPSDAFSGSPACATGPSSCCFLIRACGCQRQPTHRLPRVHGGREPWPAGHRVAYGRARSDRRLHARSRLDPGRCDQRTGRRQYPEVRVRHYPAPFTRTAAAAERVYKLDRRAGRIAADDEAPGGRLARA